jgi:hypothetical protein
MNHPWALLVGQQLEPGTSGVPIGIGEGLEHDVGWRRLGSSPPADLCHVSSLGKIVDAANFPRLP